ncbi:hypothetical protein GCD22_01871 [Acidithiobacillus thiooxidans ATCC 19377]|uniref:Uncharacterized protein n=1 Tax=Acidithiobacillus thiooxidans ATCC 19377 TaxID=637390 RepID=A0A5P9XQ18_ACITH|nr:hypothetical protein GCD22_01871 [Acidithiobacillus thiooxidans ATCC 19377]
MGWIRGHQAYLKKTKKDPISGLKNGWIKFGDFVWKTGMAGFLPDMTLNQKLDWGIGRI